MPRVWAEIKSGFCKRGRRNSVASDSFRSLSVPVFCFCLFLFVPFLSVFVFFFLCFAFFLLRLFFCLVCWRFFLVIFPFVFFCFSVLSLFLSVLFCFFFSSSSKKKRGTLFARPLLRNPDKTRSLWLPTNSGSASENCSASWFLTWFS